jgi:hypothetical protein
VNGFQFIASGTENRSSNECIDALHETLRETRLAKLVDPPLQCAAFVVAAPRDV